MKVSATNGTISMLTPLAVGAALMFATVARAEVPSAGPNPLRSPNVSANTLFLYRNSNFAQGETDTVRNGFDLQEAELAFNADVDPYSRLNVLLSVHPEYTATATGVEQAWVVEPEELFAEVTELPATTLKLGKFKAALGKHNQLHTHAFPFVEAPLIQSTLLGDEGLNDVGVSAAVLLPLAHFSEFTAEALRGEGENTAFNSPSPNDWVGVAHWKNLWDLSEELTLETGVSYALGTNALKGRTEVAGADLTFKWRPVEGGKYHSWILAGEYLNRRDEQDTVSPEQASGFDVWGQYQFAERWAALARFDHVFVEGHDASVNALALENGSVQKVTAGLSFAATEFSSYRMEYSETEGAKNPTSDQTRERKFFLQANFTIGAHPSHAY